MGMNIKNATVERLAKELAAETGETMTSAIQAALEERSGAPAPSSVTSQRRFGGSTRSLRDQALPRRA